MKKKNFTILELLLVISIAGLMLSVAAPAFSKMLKGSASSIAVRELMGKLNAARSYAMANRTYVAIVFPSDESSSTARLAYRSYRVCEITQENNSQYSFIRWIPQEDWNYFPQGIIFAYNVKKGEKDDILLTKSNKSNEETEPRDTTMIHSNALTGCTLGGRSFSEGSPTNIKNYIVFRPDGTTDKFPNGILLRLRDGRTDNDGYPIPENKPTESAYYPLVIRFNGKVKFYNELVKD